jgi:hypothetical protein
MPPVTQIDMEEDISPTEPGVISLSHLGVVDINGVDVTETELMAHALANCSKPMYEEDYMILRGSAFVNEYARVDALTGQRNDSGPSDANHLLGTFLTLFPYWQGALRPIGRLLFFMRCTPDGHCDTKTNNLEKIFIFPFKYLVFAKRDRSVECRFFK